MVLLPLRPAIAALVSPSARRRLRVKANTEEADPAPQKWELRKGLCYLVEEERPETAFRVFADQITHPDPVTLCAEGLCLTRTSPSAIRGKFGLKNTPIVWIGEQPPAPDVQAAFDCEEIAYLIAKFLRQCPNPTVVFDCLEYMSQTAEFRKTLKLIYHLKELAIKNNARLIFSVNPRSFEDRELSLLEKEMEVLNAGGAKGPR